MTEEQQESVEIRDAEAPGTGIAHPLRHEVEFGNLQANDRMILKSFVYRQMIENPGSVV